MSPFIKWFIAAVLTTVLFPYYLSATTLVEELYEKAKPNKVYIIVQKNLFPYLDKKIFERWTKQLESEGWSPIVRKPESYEIKSANRLKEYLIEQGAYTVLSLFHRKPGVILVGSFPHTYVSLNSDTGYLKSDLWLMDVSDNLHLKAKRFGYQSEILVKPDKELDVLDMWVSRIEYNRSVSIQELSVFINQYLERNTVCRISGFSSDDCQLKVQVSGNQFLDLKALIGTSDHTGNFSERFSLSNEPAGEVFLNLFEKSQRNWKQWQDYFFAEGWEHCYSFLEDMYRTHNRTHSRIGTSAAPAGIPPVDKIMLYLFKLPVLFITASSSAIYGWKNPSSRKYLGAFWALGLAASLVPQYECPNRQYTPKRHYLPVLLGDGTLRQF